MSKQNINRFVLPHGWVAVPNEPTKDMIREMRTNIDEQGNEHIYYPIGSSSYEAMIEVAPPCPILTEADVAAKARREALEEALKAVQAVGWKHNGEDQYSQGMDAGAIHQLQECCKVLRALIDKETV